MKRILFSLVGTFLFMSLAFFPFIEAETHGEATEEITDPKLPRVYFVIGIGIYIEGGTWPGWDEIYPIFLIRFGKPFGPYILYHDCGESIDFFEGDKFFGYYPFLNPIGIGFVCGLWIDV